MSQNLVTYEVASRRTATYILLHYVKVMNMEKSLSTWTNLSALRLRKNKVMNMGIILPSSQVFALHLMCSILIYRSNSMSIVDNPIDCVSIGDKFLSKSNFELCLDSSKLVYKGNSMPRVHFPCVLCFNWKCIDLKR